MTQRHWIMIAALGSAAMMLGALGFQYLGGFHPCKLCYWQRYPHVIAVVIGAIALWMPNRLLILLGALSAAVTCGFGVYHAGVELKWWEGPTTCTSGDITGMSTDALFDQIMNAPLTRCDDIVWQLAGLSMAGWNAVLSFVLVGCWLMALRRA